MPEAVAEGTTNTDSRSEELKKAENEMKNAKEAMTIAYKELYKAQDSNEADQGKKTEALQTAQREVQKKMEALSTENLKENKRNVENMAKMSVNEKALWLDRMIKDTESQINALQDGLADFNKANLAVPAIQDVRAEEPKQDKDGKDQPAEMTTQYSTAEDRFADPSESRVA